LLMILAAAIIPNTTSAVKVTPASTIAPDRLDEKLKEMKAEVLDTLSKCESGGKKEEDGIVILDTNNKGSYGIFQWQKTSVQHYFQMKTGKPISGKDAIILALDPEEARKLAEYVIFETKSGVINDWTNCSKKHGLQGKVDIISSLEK
jgi:hypothetical protein